MNIATHWYEDRISDDVVRFVNGHTINGITVVTATKTDGGIVWTNRDDATYAIIERAESILA